MSAKTAVQNALLALLGIASAGLVLELGARVRYDRPWHDQLTEQQLRFDRSDYRSNAFGVRNRDYAQPAPPGHRRVLILGDSFTFGSGVLEDDAVFPERLERRLNAELSLSGVERIDVLNGGLPGSLTGHWLALWKQVAPGFEPDLLLIVFFLRDGTRTAANRDFFGEIHDEITRRNRDSMFYQRSYLYRLYRDELDRRDISERYTLRFQQSYFGNRLQTREWRVARRNLQRLRNLARERSAAVGFVIFPVLANLDRAYPFQRICDRLESWATRNGFPVLNLLTAFRGRRAEELWVSGADQHPNALGHAIAAEAITPFAARLLREHEAAGRP